MEKIEIKFKNESNNETPEYATLGSAGCDIRAFITESITLKSLERRLIPTGLFVEIPQGYEIQVRPRSGLAYKHGITVLNSPGTIDSDYRGEIGVVLVNLSIDDFQVNSGERIAQLVLAKHEVAHFTNSEDLSETQRGTGGYGHTGKN